MDISFPKPLQLSPSILADLRALGMEKHIPANETILREEAYVKTLPIVLHGSLRVMRTDENGREILLYYIKPGESCIMSFLGGLHGETSKIRAVAEEDTELLLLPVEKLGLLLREYPEWLEYIFKLYHLRFEELLEVVNALAFKRMDDRLLDFLHTKSSLTNSRQLHLTHETLANEMGTSRVVISRLLKQMEEKQLVKLGRNKIELL
jgi:CRP/FNR family transcriptional regulator